MNLRSGVKLYDNDWFIRYGWEPEQLADHLADLNMTYVIAQSRFLPMANSAVESAVSKTDRLRYEALDDRALRDCLRERDIGYIAVENICFDPAYADAHPEDLPIDQFGRRHHREDWYVGVPPDRHPNIEEKAARLKAAVAALDPDGVHLGFIRWPGFWETWLPGDRRADKPEYCFSAQTISEFNSFAGLSLDPQSPQHTAEAILAGHREAWTTFKCRVTCDAIKTIRTVFEDGQRHLPVSINTVPLFRDDFGCAGAEVFGQDIEMLSDVVEVFEVMAYHQIMKQDALWPARIAEHIRMRSGSSAAICTVQASPLYLDGMHAGANRSATLDASEFSAMLDALENANVEGICLFTMTELMDRADTEDGRAMQQRLRRFRM
ncbi:hypothetical protein [Martelella soudanensis]|nr:hypothetical protein [Martelella sp. NC18]